jgi:hypothetical protein
MNTTINTPAGPIVAANAELAKLAADIVTPGIGGSLTPLYKA